MKQFTDYHFAGQKEGEEILLVARRHWFNILQQMILIVAMFLIFVGSYLFLPTMFLSLGRPPLNMFLSFIENIFLMMIWLVFFTVWIDYYFDIWIITNKRIVNVEQKGLFSRNVSELELERIQDITTEVHGVIPTFLNYGTVYIQTAGEKERFIFNSVPNPYTIKDLIMNLQKIKEKEETNELGEMIHQKIHDEQI